MQLIVVRPNKAIRQLEITRSKIWALALTIVGLGFLTVWGGFALGQRNAAAPFLAQASKLRVRLSKQQKKIDAIETNSQASIDAVAAQMGILKARVRRLDAMGSEIVKLAGISKSGFDFKRAPGEGGPLPSHETPWALPDLSRAITAFSGRVWSERQQLVALESILLHKKLHAQIIPTGNPVRGGWISSGWGWRTDPFTGEREFHEGLDIADHKGTKIHAVAAGVVTWAGPRYGFGNLVIINSGDGYATFYAHDEKVLVKVGDVVKRGQVVALMGQTGRATGPHVHFEVVHNGHPVDPLPYVRH